MSAFQVITEVDVVIDHFELGVEFMSDWDNEQQAEFFRGVSHGLKDLGGNGYLQILYIADAAKNAGNGDELERLADIFSEYFKQPR